MGHRVSTPVPDDRTGAPPTPTGRNRGRHHPNAGPHSKIHRSGGGTIRTTNLSPSTSFLTLTMVVLLCGVVATSSSPSRNRSPPSYCAFAALWLDRPPATAPSLRPRCRPSAGPSPPLGGVRRLRLEPVRAGRNGKYRPLPSVPGRSGGGFGGRRGIGRSGPRRRCRIGAPLRLTLSSSAPSSSALHTSPPGASQPKEDSHSHNDDDEDLRNYPNRGRAINAINNHRYRRRRNRHKKRLLSRGKISSAAQIHYDDALLTRIVKGQKSDSPRWRKRTKHAAASFGFRLEENHRSRLRTKRTAAPNPPPPPNHNALQPVPTPPRSKRSRPRRSAKKTPLTPEQYQTQKLLWASRYTSLSTLRSTFGSNRNKFWGDFDPSTTRRIYNTLLPRALLGLYEMGLWSPSELAPLAYEARVAAKKYARERCVVPGRVVAMLYDGFRSWREWGTWSVEGMSWEQVWDKYETQILEEMLLEEDHGHHHHHHEGGLEEEEYGTEEVTAQICLRILERSCITNERINQMLLGEDEDEENYRKPAKRRRNAERYLGMIAAKLDTDMKELMGENDERQFVDVTTTTTTLNAST